LNLSFSSRIAALTKAAHSSLLSAALKVAGWLRGCSSNTKDVILFRLVDNGAEYTAFVSAAILELNERFKVALSKLPTLDSGVVPPVHALNEGWPLLFLEQCDGYCEQHRVSSSTLTRTLTTIQHMEITPPEDSWVAPCVALPTNMVLISGVPVHKQLGDVYVVCDNGKLTVRYWELYSKGKHRLSEPYVVARRNSELVARDYTEEELEMFLDYIEYVGKLPNQVYSKHISARHLQAMLEWAFHRSSPGRRKAANHRRR
jgi:hypothetical protein